MPIKHINLFSFKVTLTILDINSEKLLKCTEDGQAMQVLNDYLQGIYNDEAMALSTEPRTAEKVDMLGHLLSNNHNFIIKLKVNVLTHFS